jgi:hypothetical protein
MHITSDLYPRKLHRNQTRHDIHLSEQGHLLRPARSRPGRDRTFYHRSPKEKLTGNPPPKGAQHVAL